MPFGTPQPALACGWCNGTKYLAHAALVDALAPQFSTITDAKLRQAAEELRVVFRIGRDTPDLLYRAMAVIREVNWRQLGMKPYLEQVAGALALEAGCIVEMATGEGKTLTATLPATIAGWRRQRLPRRHRERLPGTARMPSGTARSTNFAV